MCVCIYKNFIFINADKNCFRYSIKKFENLIQEFTKFDVIAILLFI